MFLNVVPWIRGFVMELTGSVLAWEVQPSPIPPHVLWGLGVGTTRGISQQPKKYCHERSINPRANQMFIK